MQSLKIRAKRVGAIKDKICILKKQDTFVLSSICQKCQGTQIKEFLRFELKGEYKEPLLFVYFSLIPKDKNAFMWVPWHFLHMLDKTKVSCIFKIQIFSAYFRRLHISLKIRVKRERTIKMKCVFLSYKKLVSYQAYAKNVSIPK